MSNEELARNRAALDFVVREYGSSKEKALDFLVDCGILTPAGDLTEQYRPKSSDSRA